MSKKYPCVVYTNSGYDLPTSNSIRNKYYNKYRAECLAFSHFEIIYEKTNFKNDIHKLLDNNKNLNVYFHTDVKPFLHPDEKEEIIDLYLSILNEYDGDIPHNKIEKLIKLTRFSVSKKRKIESMYETTFECKKLYNINAPKLYIDGYNKVMKNKNIKLTEENFVSLYDNMNFISKIPYIRNFYRGKLNAYLALSGIDYLIERNNKIWGVTQQCSVIEIPLNDIKSAQVN